ncbi:hypothetical protein EPO15_10540 [bacterium]|nr:MAG: hypothetical protein EPO15_10540 [bacterium]
MKTLTRRGVWKPVPGPAPLPAIPRLRETEKKEERKGGAAPWLVGGGPGPGALAGGASVRVGNSLAARSDLLGRLCAALSGALGGPATGLGRLFASAAGRWLVGAGLAAWGVLLLAAAARVFGWGHESQAPDTPTFAEPPVSSVRIRPGADRSLDYVAAANKGEILDAPAKTVEKSVPAPELPAAPPPEPAEVPPPADEPPAVRPKEVLRPLGWGRTREGFGLAGGAGSSQGGALSALGTHAGVNFPPLGGSAGGAFEGPKAGRLGGLQRARQALATRRLGALRGRSTRAIGQLKLANALSMLGAVSDSDQLARSMASDAFDQKKTAGGELAGVLGGTGVVAPLGSGAPDLGVTPGAPDVPPGVNVTPYQNQVDNARGLGEQAAALKNQGMMLLMMGGMLLMIGLALMAAGAALMAAPPPMNLIGIALMGAGAALAAAGGAMISQGMEMLQQAQQMAQQAKNQGNDIDKRYGQPEQGGIVGQCAQQSADTGITVDACAARNPAGNQAAHGNVHQAVTEEANAGFTLKPAEPR